MRLEGVILAAGSGSRMVELTRGRPKCLLTVGNQSLIWFAITGLKHMGVSRIILLVPDQHEADIKQYCQKKFGSLKDVNLEFIAAPSEADRGTAESLLEIRDKIRGDFVVYSCDSIVDPRALTALLNHYRLYDPMMTMLLSDNLSYFQPRTAPGRREKESYMRDVIATEPIDKLELAPSAELAAKKVVFLHSERHSRQNLRIKSKELALHPSLEVCSKFLDTHIYIFKRQMLDFMLQNKDRAVLNSEMIPLLISKQFSSPKDQIDEEDDIQDIRGLPRQCDYESELKEKLENLNPKHVTKENYIRRTNLDTPIACHALTIKDLQAHRANTLFTYLDCNRNAKALLSMFGVKSINAIKDCVVGENTTIGEKTLIKHGSIGNNCKIGDKVKLFDCILMDNVEIASNTNLTECIVASSSRIGSKCDLKQCIIGYNVPNSTKSTGEVLIKDGLIDLSDPLIAENE